jgi:hypothetical protein
MLAHCAADSRDRQRLGTYQEAGKIMAWELAASIAELIGAAAVVISLVYLAVQVRSATRELRTTTRDSAIQKFMEFNYCVMSDADPGWIFQAGCRDFRSLEEKDRTRLVHAMYSFFKMFENIYLHYLDRSVDEKVWPHNSPMLVAYASQPGAQFYLSHRREISTLGFGHFLKNTRHRTCQPDMLSTNSVTKNQLNKEY